MGKKIYFVLALVGVGTLLATGAFQWMVDTGTRIVETVQNIWAAF